MKKILILLSVLVIPFIYFIIWYLAGFGVIPRGIDIIASLCGLFFGSLITTFCVFWIWRWENKYVVAFLYFIFQYVIVFLIFPAGGVIWTHGFVHSFGSKVNYEQLQSWAAETLARHKTGEIKIQGEGEYWSPGREKLADEEVPAFLKNAGLEPFSAGIGVANSIGDEYVAVAWYLHGFIIGSPSFKTDWNPWYIKEIRPGIYAYHAMK